MAQDIVPIELGLPQGDVVTLWAPRWREDGEEWEAFLGHEEDLYAFPDTAHLTAFVRTVTEHDLADHPAWHVVPALSAIELVPDADHQYDLVGVPELVADDPDTWVIGELADIITMVRSLADVCELDDVLEILDGIEGFGLLDQGMLPFTGREGARLWTDLATAVVDKWDDVLDAVDEVVSAPDVDEQALAAAEVELAEAEETPEQDADVLAEADTDDTDDDTDETDDDSDEDSDDSDEDGDEDSDEDDEALVEEPVGFWAEVGIDPIKIETSLGDYYTLRCYLDDEPLFLGTKGKIDAFKTQRALARHLADSAGEDNDLAGVVTWDEVTTRATDGSLSIDVDPENVYILTGIAEDIADGPDTIDPTQLDLAVELLEDTADWSGDEKIRAALRPSEGLGWLVSFVLRPDPTRLAPKAPFDTEQAAWRDLMTVLEGHLNVH